MDENLDIYGDIDVDEIYQEKNKERENARITELENEIKKNTDDIAKLKKDNERLNKKVKIMETNFNNLFDVVKSELNRKDSQIDALRKEKDNLIFRRKTGQESSSLQENHSNGNPFRGDSKHLSTERKDHRDEKDARERVGGSRDEVNRDDKINRFRDEVFKAKDSRDGKYRNDHCDRARESRDDNRRDDSKRRDSREDRDRRDRKRSRSKDRKRKRSPVAESRAREPSSSSVTKKTSLKHVVNEDLEHELQEQLRQREKILAQIEKNSRTHHQEIISSSVKEEDIALEAQRQTILTRLKEEEEDCSASSEKIPHFTMISTISPDVVSMKEENPLGKNLSSQTNSNVFTAIPLDNIPIHAKLEIEDDSMDLEYNNNVDVERNNNDLETAKPPNDEHLPLVGFNASEGKARNDSVKSSSDETLKIDCRRKTVGFKASESKDANNEKVAKRYNVPLKTDRRRKSVGFKASGGKTDKSNSDGALKTSRKEASLKVVKLLVTKSEEEDPNQKVLNVLATKASRKQITILTAKETLEGGKQGKDGLPESTSQSSISTPEGNNDKNCKPEEKTSASLKKAVEDDILATNTDNSVEGSVVLEKTPLLELYPNSGEGNSKLKAGKSTDTVEDVDNLDQTSKDTHLKSDVVKMDSQQNQDYLKEKKVSTSKKRSESKKTLDKDRKVSKKPEKGVDSNELKDNIVSQETATPSKCVEKSKCKRDSKQNEFSKTKNSNEIEKIDESETISVGKGKPKCDLQQNESSKTKNSNEKEKIDKIEGTTSVGNSKSPEERTKNSNEREKTESLGPTSVEKSKPNRDSKYSDSSNADSSIEREKIDKVDDSRTSSADKSKSKHDSKQSDSSKAKSSNEKENIKDPEKSETASVENQKPETKDSNENEKIDQPNAKNESQSSDSNDLLISHTSSQILKTKDGEIEGSEIISTPISSSPKKSDSQNQVTQNDDNACSVQQFIEEETSAFEGETIQKHVDGEISEPASIKNNIKSAKKRKISESAVKPPPPKLVKTEQELICHEELFDSSESAVLVNVAPNESEQEELKENNNKPLEDANISQQFSTLDENMRNLFQSPKESLADTSFLNNHISETLMKDLEISTDTSSFFDTSVSLNNVSDAGNKKNISTSSRDYIIETVDEYVTNVTIKRKKRKAKPKS